MALSKATRDLENIVMCAICLENFSDKDPRTLHCLHAFCVQCLNQLYSPRAGFITCPTCTEQTKLPKGSVYNLRRYFVARQVINYRNSSLIPTKYPIQKLRVWKNTKLHKFVPLDHSFMKQSLGILSYMTCSHYFPLSTILTP